MILFKRSLNIQYDILCTMCDIILFVTLSHTQNLLETRPEHQPLPYPIWFRFKADAKNKPKRKTIPQKNAKHCSTFVSCWHNTDSQVIKGEYHYQKSQFPEVSLVNNLDQLIDNWWGLIETGQTGSIPEHNRLTTSVLDIVSATVHRDDAKWRSVNKDRTEWNY